MAALATVGFGAFRPAAASAETRNMVYKVTHSSYGEIGTYANLVQTNGDTTTVTTTVHLVVKVLGIVMHREDDQRTEEWKNNRLVAFHGVTDKNGDKIVVNGRAKATVTTSFIINTPSGTYAAPASVHPANPWSAASLQSTTMMQVDTGKVGPVQVLGGGATAVDVDGTKITAREYEVDGAKRSRVWIDGQGVPVKFTVDDDSGIVSFTLVR